MNRTVRVIPTVLRQIVRSPIRSGLTIAGIAVAMFLFVSVESMREGVRTATRVQAEDTTLVVYRENRFCPFSSRLPQFYGDRIERLDGVKAVVPMQIHVSNCRASLDVVTFRGVPRDDLTLAIDGQVRDGSIADWQARGDAAIVGEALATRRGIKTGDRFSAAGVTVYVSGILETDHPQNRNIVWVHLPFLQEVARRGGSGGLVTQFNVSVDDPTELETIAASIDEIFAHDEYPTSTRPERAFVGRVARDIVELVDFAGMLAWGALAAVFALIANAIILAMQDRIRDHAVLQTLGFTGSLIGWMVVLEGAALGLAGGLAGAIAAFLTVRLGNFSLTMEGLNIEIVAGWLAPTLGIAAALTLGLLAGVVPAIRLARRDIASCFRAV
ncbi:MAG: ABC transporter permease [Phycisphaerales bacterium]|jgi:putative ABC transport system permease protein|nr:ABC transporter permease [Phycisphaerales bacterium]MDP7087180.1 ABC transporter permease [Phycisphaerales bacterium]MDP7188591.1 ABC transporter permease [Phycisphaerales bacterium]MDP7520580.1 ABC transporter permease [Phycisphaerales bacterium]MDP7573474.1 ABC transporter permease [Phycisphaerales bacterium]|tara:strand:+ start:10910 stop:12064 length:1155 start_codon:yes stop_codon:yes gene_type:complete